MPRILVVTAGLAGKRSPFAEALVYLYDAEVIPGKSRAETQIDRIWRKLGLADYIGTNASNIRKINRAILERDFDILFVIKGNLVTAKTLSVLKMRAVPPRIIGWSPDDIYLAHNNSPTLKAAAPYYDTFYTAKSFNIINCELKSMGFSDPRFLHQGFDPDFHRPMPNPLSRFAGLATFIGYAEQDRFEKLNHLAKNGLEIHVWGSGWSAAMCQAAHHNLVIHGHPLLGNDYIDALSNSAISFCFLDSFAILLNPLNFEAGASCASSQSSYSGIHVGSREIRHFLICNIFQLAAIYLPYFLSIRSSTAFLYSCRFSQQDRRRRRFRNKGKTTICVDCDNDWNR